MQESRRGFIKASAGGVALMLAYSVGGGTLLLSPGQARAQGVKLDQLSRTQYRTLEKLAEALVPGAAKAGIAHFVDHQLGCDPNDALLIAKYFQVRPPYKGFYRQGLAATATFAKQQFGKSLRSLNAKQLDALVGRMGRPGTKVGGFDLSLFYLCLRSDAVDLVYGTPEGFARLDVPMMAHIMPPETWNA